MAGDSALLDHVRVVRNKLLHAELRTVRERLSQLGHPPGPQRVYSFAVPRGLTRAAFLEAMANARSITDQDDRADVFSWFLQLNVDGTLDAAAAVFTEAIRLVTRLGQTG